MPPRDKFLFDRGWTRMNTDNTDQIAAKERKDLKHSAFQFRTL
jgi:hypothetical protein